MTPDNRARASFHRNGTVWQITLTCLYCGKKHTHGGGLIRPGAKEPDRSFFSHRHAHCTKRQGAWEDGYVLVHPGDMLYPDLGY